MARLLLCAGLVAAFVGCGRQVNAKVKDLPEIQTAYDAYLESAATDRKAKPVVADEDVSKRLAHDNLKTITSEADMKDHKVKDAKWAGYVRDFEDALANAEDEDAKRRWFARGQYQDKTYIYDKCDRCRGRGFDGTDLCTVCFGSKVKAVKGWRTQRGDRTVRDAVEEASDFVNELLSAANDSPERE